MSPTTQGRLVGSVVFASAFLLFTIELLVGKAALPRFGGTSAVWTTSLFFFQAALLAGYGYAHLLATRLSLAAQRAVHTAAAVLAALVLVAQAGAWGTPFLPPAAAAGPIGPAQVVAFLAAACGAPFVLLATTGPLLQHWYASATQGAPWRFYAVSNAGSLSALVAYPFVFEPWWGLSRQAQAVGVVFLAWVAALGLAASRLLRTAPALAVTAASGRATGAPKGGRRRAEPLPGPPRTSAREAATWVGLSALGTLLLSAVNNVMCQDVAPTPLLWALPLGLYLSSFIVTFAGQRRFGPRAWVALWLLGLALLLVHTVKSPDVPLAFTVAAFSTAHLGASLLCHGALYRLRPPAARLSAFYLWMALGGVLGSLAVGFFAPLVFRDYAEFSLGLGAVGAGAALALVRRRPTPGRVVAALASVGLVGAVVFLERHLVSGVLETRRNFFGVLRVQEEGTPGEADHVRGLRHGNILHGVQWAHPSKRDEPTTYYTHHSGLGAAVASLRARRAGGLSVEVLGLGLGTAAALLEAGDDVDFVEVNPDVIALAEGDGGYFSVLSRSRATVHTTLGDARQVLEARRAAGAPLRDLLVVDVFSGDAVPAHLFTVEAFELYFARLSPRGLLALHVSNRHLRLGRVALGIAAARGWPAVLLVSRSGGFATSATWVVVAREAGDLPPAQVGDVFRDVRHAVDDPRVWTDDFQSVLHVLRTD